MRPLWFMQFPNEISITRSEQFELHNFFNTELNKTHNYTCHLSCLFLKFQVHFCQIFATIQIYSGLLGAVGLNFLSFASRSFSSLFFFVLFLEISQFGVTGIEMRAVDMVACLLLSSSSVMATFGAKFEAGANSPSRQCHVFSCFLACASAKWPELHHDCEAKQSGC